MPPLYFKSVLQGLKDLINSHIPAIFLLKILLASGTNILSTVFSPINFYGETHALYQKQSRTNLQFSPRF